MDYQNQHRTVQRLAELVGGGPCDGEKVDIGTCDELSHHLARHTQLFVHYYVLQSERGLWVYRHRLVMRRGCGR